MTKPIVFVALAALFAAVLGVWILTEAEIVVESSAQHKFTIDQRMPRVRKILVRTNAVKKIVAMADAELLDQKWLDVKFDPGRKLLDRDWQVDGKGQLNVVVNNSYLGAVNLTINQKVDIQPDKMEVVSTLGKSSGAITKYSSRVDLTTDDKGKASFQTSLTLAVSTRANFFTRAVVKRNIQAAAADALESQERAFRGVVDEKRGDLMIVPDKLTK